ncbi:MAG: hypothetical protein WC358_05980 [Ignavibacteria bacterium]|jgi:hypothetical protein
MKKLYFLLLLPLLYFYGCTGGCSTSCSSESCKDLVCGKYFYTMTDSVDNKLIEGVINISDCEGDKIGGTYSKDKIYNDNFLGFSSMTGFFSGNVKVNEKKASINTNPKIADNNIFIGFDIKNESLTGKWTFSTMRGKIGWGYFSAVKVKN